MGFSNGNLGGAKANGWNWLPFPSGNTLQALDEHPREGTSILDHIELRAPPALAKVIVALADAIRDPKVIGMDDVRVVIDLNATVVIIIVGTKK